MTPRPLLALQHKSLRLNVTEQNRRPQQRGKGDLISWFCSCSMSFEAEAFGQTA
jgi:hypothetical protein